MYDEMMQHLSDFRAAATPINFALTFLKRETHCWCCCCWHDQHGSGAGITAKLFDGGVYWGDSAVRVMVLWVTMLALWSRAATTAIFVLIWLGDF